MQLSAMHTFRLENNMPIVKDRCHLDNLDDALLSKYANVSVTHFKMFYLPGQSFRFGDVSSRLIVHVHTDWTPGSEDLSKSQKPYPFLNYVTCSD